MKRLLLAVSAVAPAVPRLLLQEHGGSERGLPHTRYRCTGAGDVIGWRRF